jgi:hypothetical protein
VTGLSWLIVFIRPGFKYLQKTYFAEMFGRLNNEMKFYLLLFLVATLGGAIRKWYTESGLLSNFVLFVQMMVPFLMYIFRSSNTNSPFEKFNILYLYFFYLGFHIIYPLQLTFYHGIFGMIIHGGFWLLLFYYISNRHVFNPKQLMNTFIIIGILEVVLGFIQYQLPTTHFLNRYANMEIIKNIAIVGDRPRITGTFSFLSGYTAYLIFAAMLVWAFIRLKYPPWIVFTATICIFITGFMTGSRTATVMNIVILLPVFIQEYSLKIVTSVAGRLIIPLGIVVMVSLLYKDVPGLNQVNKAYENFMERVETNRRSGEQTSRFFTDIRYIQYANWQHPLLGVGLGATYQGATYLFGTSPYVIEFGYVESELTRIALEGGIVMIFFKLILGILLVKNLMIRGLMRWIVFFTFSLFNPIVFNVHNAAFIAMGIILVDNIIWRQGLKEWEERKRKEEEVSEELGIGEAGLVT